MKKQTLLLLLLLISFAAISQESRIIDDTPVGLGISIEDGQTELKQYNVFHEIITPPTVIKKEKNSKGELYMKLYINVDQVEVIATKINDSDKHLYKAFEQSTFIVEGKLLTSPKKIERAIRGVYYEPDQSPYCKIESISDNSRRIYEYSVVEVQSGKVVSTLKLEFAFPKPEPRLLSIHKQTILWLEDRPGDNISLGDNTTSIRIFKEGIISKNLVKTNFDPNTNMPEQLVLPQDINTFLIEFKPLKNEVMFLEYKFSTDSTWKTTVLKKNPFIILRDLKTGKYKLQVRYPHQDDAVWEYEFEIEPVWTQTTSFKVFLGSIITAFFCFSLFVVYNKRQKRKLKQEVAQRKQLQNQINALRSQLDPHFIFNALNSIQSLINKTDIESANLYIAKFGALLHEVLEKSDTTMHPLAIEIRQVEYYLQLEQLRFKFEYKIIVDSGLNTSEIDIPVMLLQPYIENAIKHGIIEKREQGIIELGFTRHDSNMIVSVKDNGKGYDVNNNKSGHGNILVKERMDALNKLLKDQQIIVEAKSVINEGSCITISFLNWL